MDFSPAALMRNALAAPFETVGTGLKQALEDASLTYVSVWAVGREAVAAVEDVREGLFVGALEAGDAVGALLRTQLQDTRELAADVLSLRSPLDALVLQADLVSRSARSSALGSKAITDWGFALGRRLAEPFSHFAMDVRGPDADEPDSVAGL
ncbi:MAG: hypothetical protein H6923_04535 [Alphaproteobacteria bacterium]|nr:hypothetical protein [Alphaproteobacteria bacterium]